MAFVQNRVAHLVRRLGIFEWSRSLKAYELSDGGSSGTCPACSLTG